MKTGHQLASMTKTGQTMTYKYDADGLRTYKSDGTTVTKYYWTGSHATHVTKGSTTMHLYYDQAGRPLMINYAGTNYYYKLNLQGDVIGIVNTSGTEVVSYTYDAWGKQLTCTGSLAATLGTDNPLRYRGYIYDADPAHNTYWITMISFICWSYVLGGFTICRRGIIILIGAEPAPQAARLSAGQPGRRSGERGYREERREAAGAVARPG